MRRTRIFGLAFVAALTAMGAGLGCSSSDDEPANPPNGDVDSGTSDDGDTPDGDIDPGPGLGIDSAPAAKVIASVDFDEPVTTSIAAGPYVFVLYADKGCGVLDLSDPEEPIDRGRIETPARIVSVAYDEGNQLAYLASDKGDILAIDMTIPGTHTKLASLNVSSLAGGIQGMTRVGDRLFAVSGNTLQPLGLLRDSVTKAVTKIELQAPVTLDEPATVIDAGGGNLFIGNAKGKLEIFEAPAGKSAPKALGSIDMGGELKGIVVRGSKVLGIANGAGLKAIDFVKPAAPKVLFESDEIADASGIRVFGTTLVVGLDRAAVSTLDISKIGSPRAVTTNKGKLPEWIAISRGQLFFGDQKKGSVANIPAFLSGRVTGPTRDSFPLKGFVPVTLSKEIDPASVSPDTVKLSCDGKEVAGTPTVMPLQHTFIFRPTKALPAGASCKLDLSGVQDRLGELVSAPDGGAVMDFTTASDASKPVTNPGSKFPHKTDGKFSDLVVPEVEGDTQAQVKNEGEWSDVTPAKGMYTYFYADFDGEYLWLMNDWFYGGENIEPDCYNQFHVWTGGGSEWWDVRAFGDQHVEVRKNGVLLDPEVDGVEGGASYSSSPNLAEPHTMYEIRVPASPGAWGVQLHDPGPTFNCHVIEQEPHPMQGDLIEDGETTTTIDISEPVAPSDVTLFAPFDEMTVDPPVKLVWQTKEGLDFTIYQVQVATDPSFTVKSRVLDVGTYASSLDLRSGLLEPGKTYYWHVIAWNTSGSTTSATRSFTVFGETGEEPDGGAGGSDGGTSDEALWSKGFESGNIDPQRLAVDKVTGDVVVVGTFGQDVTFGNETLTPSFGDNETAFIARFDEDGKALWSKQFKEDWNRGMTVRVALDDEGNVIVAGTFEGTINLGGQELKSAGARDIFVAKLTKAGDYVFSKRFGGGGDDSVAAVAVNSAYSIVMAGTFSGTIDFGGDDLVSVGTSDVFVARLGSSGDHIASRRFGDASGESVGDFVLDSNGNLIIAGSFMGAFDCGLGAKPSLGGNDAFIMKLDEKLDCQWQYEYGSVDLSESISVLGLDPQNNVYFAGVQSSAPYMGRLTSAGAFVWAKKVPAFALRGIAGHVSGGVVLTGSYVDGADFGKGPLSSPAGRSNVFFARYDAEGNHVDSRGIVAGNGSGGHGIAASPDDAHIAMGMYLGGIDLGNGSLPNNGMFLTKMRFNP